MLGRRSTQTGLFDAGSLIDAEQIDRIPFYGDLARSWRTIFPDEAFAAFYVDGKGRPSVPPSILATATVLQGHEGISDYEVVERTKYDLRWKVVFDTDPCSLTPLFAKSTYQQFRLNLVLKGEQGAIFQAVLDEAKRNDLVPKKLRLALDSTPVRGRGAVKDAFNLLSDAIGKVLRAIGKATEEDPRNVAKRLELTRHLERGSVKGSRVVDWDDEASVRAFLAELVADCQRVVGAAGKSGVTGEQLDLLAKVVTENVEEGPDGARIPQQVPKGRTTSVHDPDMRHGHKSNGKIYTGHKIHAARDVESQFLTAIEVDAPGVAEGAHVGSLIEQSKARTGADVTEGLGDCAYGTRPALAEAEQAKVPLVTKMPAPPKGRFGPGDFTVSDDGETATCPAGHQSVKVGHPKQGVMHRWSEEQCGPCPLKGQCLYRESKNRNLLVTPDFHERRAREAYAHSPEGREKLRDRVVIEHGFGAMKNLGAGAARYVGRAKTLFQAFLAGAVVNLRRLFARLAPALAQVLVFTCLPLLFLAAGARQALGSAHRPDQRTSALSALDRGTGGQPAPPASTLLVAASPPPSLRVTPVCAVPEPEPPSSAPSPRRRWLLGPGHSPGVPPPTPPHLPAPSPLPAPHEPRLAAERTYRSVAERDVIVHTVVSPGLSRRAVENSRSRGRCALPRAARPPLLLPSSEPRLRARAVSREERSCPRAGLSRHTKHQGGWCQRPRGRAGARTQALRPSRREKRHFRPGP